MADEPNAPAAAPAAPTATPAPATPAEPSSSDIMSFDPFAPAKSAEPAAQEPVAPVEPTAPVAPAGPTIEEQLAEANGKIAEFEAWRAQQVAAQAAPAQAQSQPQQAQPAQPAKRYGFQVPQQIFEGLNSEDPNQRNQSLVTIMNGVAEVIHDTVLKQVEGMVQEISKQMPQVAQQTVQQQTEHKAVFDDFYGTFPELNQPHFHQFVSQMAQAVGQRMKVNGWSPALRDEIGREVYKALKWPIPGQRTNAPKPPASTSSSARPGSPTPLDEQSKQMLDLLT